MLLAWHCGMSVREGDLAQISTEAQALIDRLARVDPAKPRNDKTAIEKAVTAFLAALGVECPPLVWAEDARTGYRCVVEQAGVKGARKPRWDTRWEAAWFAARDAIGDDKRGAAWDAAYDAADPIAEAAAREKLWAAALDATRWAAWSSVPPSAMGAVWDHPGTPWANARIGIAYLNGLAVFDHPAIAKYAEIELAMLDAFEAGLFRYWITRSSVICVMQPTLSVVDDDLHRADGPAVWWPSGEQYFFWRGVEVPAWAIEEPEKITDEAMRDEEGETVRRAMAAIRTAWEENKRA
jgi:hypothetical protein